MRIPLETWFENSVSPGVCSAIERIQRLDRAVIVIVRQILEIRRVVAVEQISVLLDRVQLIPSRFCCFRL
jgi:hypothetical protein